MYPCTAGHLRQCQGQEADDQLLHRHRQQPPPCRRDHARRHVQPKGINRYAHARSIRPRIRGTRSERIAHYVTSQT